MNSPETKKDAGAQAPNANNAPQSSLDQIKALRQQFATTARDLPGSEKARQEIIARILQLCSQTAQPANCPHCGRPIRIPPCGGEIRLGCKKCREIFSYNPATDQMTFSRARSEDNTAAPAGNGKWLWAVAAILLALAALAAYAFWPLHEEEPPVVTGEPGSVLEDVRRQLKSLAE